MVFVGVAVLAAAVAASAVAVADRSASAALAPLSEADIELVATGAGQATVGIEADTCGGRMAGSGFVAEGRVVTSAHLVEGAAEMLFEGAGLPVRVAVGGTLHPADLAISAPLTDRTPTSGATLELASGPPADGTPVVIVARVGGRLRWLAAVARTVAGAAYGAAGPLLVLDRPVAPGWSGGPVVNRSGRVVGVVRAVDASVGVTLAELVDQLHVPDQTWREDDIERPARISCKSDRPKG
ncbi:MAG: serine protease [Acidimicrobiia bacterium]|nr:serine protease [Acidimicrobiia bacterium]MDH5291406.1 serine protease [Acidimicrobiia bacterium]